MVVILNFRIFAKNTKFASICKIERFRRNLWPTGYEPSQLATFPENRFPAIFGGFLADFWIFAKYAKTHLSRTRCEIGQFWQNIWPAGYQQSILVTFSQIVFLPLLPAILNFCVKCKNAFISETVLDRVISSNFWPQDIRRVYWPLFSKMIFPPILAAILNFCVKHKNEFILEMVTAISTKFLTHRESADLLATFLKNCFLAIFGGHLEILCKMKKKNTFIYWRLFAKIVFLPRANFGPFGYLRS